MGDGTSAPYNWNYTCPGGESPYHNMTITGDYHQVEGQWQVECTEHQIAFQCCTDDCACHDPVVTHDGATSSTNDVAATSNAEPSTTSSVAVPAVASVVGLAAVGGVVVARARGCLEQRDELQVALSSDTGYAEL